MALAIANRPGGHWEAMTARTRTSTFVIAGAIALMAAWMPWVSYTAREYVGMIASDFGVDKDEIDMAMIRKRAGVSGPRWFELDAWHSRLEPIDVGLPNWIVPILAACLGVLAIARERRWLEVSWKVFFAVALYMSAHAAVFLTHALVSASLRAGSVIAAAACLAMLLASVGLRRDETDCQRP